MGAIHDLYFDDLHLESTGAAAECIAGEAREGYARGHRAFKIKVGRGARHMPLETGTERDIAVVELPLTGLVKGTKERVELSERVDHGTVRFGSKLSAQWVGELPVGVASTDREVGP